MPRIILKCPYLKGGTAKASAHIANLVSYMATRNGVEKLTEKNRNLPSTAKQADLIEQIIKEFPGTKNLFEYEDYIKNKTIENASELISIALEQNLDKIGQRKNYVDYIANRPRVEKMGTHGLFTGGDDAIVLSRVADEVANHTGNVWTPIISLRREDAIRTRYDGAETWHNMLSYFAPEIAESMKISVQNFRWYAAFHNESHHPHVHMICYSVNPADGYLTKKGIERIKSGLLKNIFKNEMQITYEEQSQRRDRLKSESRETMLKLISEMKSGVIQNPKIEELFLNLSERLQFSKGKRVYGYLQPNMKAIVDEIIDELSKEEAVAKAYELWYEMREEVLYSYMDELPERLPLSKQKEFKSIKNIIIAEADKIAKGEVIFEEGEIAELEDIESLSKTENSEWIETSETAVFEPTYDEISDDTDIECQEVYVKWTDEYKQAREYLFGTEETPQDFEKALNLFLAEAENGNVLAMYDLGRMYADGLGVESDNDKANKYYAKALSGFEQVESQKAWKYTEYRIGKMFAQGLGTEQDYEIAAQWFELSAEKKYKYAQCSLGGLYYRGQGLEQDFQTAFSLYLKSAEQGFPYADYEVAKMYRDGVGTEKDADKSNRHFKKAFNGFEALEKNSHDDKLQYRLGWMLQNGIGTQKDITRAKEYFEKSAKMGNVFAGYSLAKLILAEENPNQEELQKAIEYLQKADNENDICKPIRALTLYALGKIYLDGKHIPKDIYKAIAYLTQSAEQENEWAAYQLGKLYLIGKGVLKDTEKAVVYLTKAAEQRNQFAQYILGKLYLLGKDILKNRELAIKWLTLSAEQGNEYAQFFLDNMDKFREPSVALGISRLMYHVGRMFENNVPMPDKSAIGFNVDSKLMRKMKEKKVGQGYKQDDWEKSLLI